jgi:hypothetical protein
MNGMQEAVPGTDPGDWWTQMERVFHLSDQTASDAAPSAAVTKIPKA